MNFETLKVGFVEYLEQVQEEKPWKHYKTDSDNVSIFLYADEFKDYIKSMQGRYGIDASVCNESVEEILKMQFVDGKLVTKEEAEEMGEETNGESLKDCEVVNQNPDEALPDETQEVQDTGEEGVVQGGEDGEVNPDDAQNPVISNESTQNYADQNSVNIDNPELITGIINDLLTDDLFKSVLDTDGDGEINDEELKAFLDVVKCYDEDPDTISLNDLMAAASDIQSGMFKFATDEEIKETIGETPIADAAGLTATPAPAGTNGAGGSYSVPNSYKENVQKYDENGKAILENLSKDELNAELNKAKGELSEKQKTYESIQSGTHPELAELKANMEKAYEDYQEQLESKDSEMSEQLEKYKADVDEKQRAVDENNIAISQQTDVVNDCQIAYDNAKSRRASLEAQFGLLEAAESGAEDDKLSEIQNKKAALEQEIEKAKTAENDAYQKLTEEQEKLSNLENPPSPTPEDALEEAKSAQEKYENEICEKYPELQEYLDAYRDAKETYETRKEELSATAKQEIQEAQEYVSRVSDKLNEAETADEIKENYSAGAKGEDMIELAKKFLGYSEGQVESVCGYNLPDGLWCAAFCKYIATEVYGDDLPSWYTNCNYNSCSEILAAANNNNSAFRDGSQAQAGDFVIFNTSRGQARHIGMVIDVAPDGTLTTIEGNTSSRVDIRTYNVNDSSRVNSFVRIR